MTRSHQVTALWWNMYLVYSVTVSHRVTALWRNIYLAVSHRVTALWRNIYIGHTESQHCVIRNIYIALWHCDGSSSESQYDTVTRHCDTIVGLHGIATHIPCHTVTVNIGVGPYGSVTHILSQCDTVTRLKHSLATRVILRHSPRPIRKCDTYSVLHCDFVLSAHVENTQHNATLWTKKNATLWLLSRWQQSLCDTYVVSHCDCSLEREYCVHCCLV